MASSSLQAPPPVQLDHEANVAKFLMVVCDGELVMLRLIRISEIFNCYESRIGLVNYLAYSCSAYE